MQRCPIHKQYQGIRYPKRKCSNCIKLYHEVQSKSNEYGKYVSITTPDLKCGLGHLLAEISTVMLYGPQPRFFWWRNILANPTAKKHFQKIKTQIGFWMKRDQGQFKDTEKILWTIFNQYWKGFKFNENTYVVVEKDEVVERIPAELEDIFTEEEIRRIKKKNMKEFFDPED
jgi:hypothetical protein